ncbi:MULTISPECIES: HAMP domain-containing sensor histidine kinase [unclassified Actinomadura]|uniref:sensor histidine kinase n=1 Tax=unclassified Actinomadura TaxID=2626254 RepID=UPI00190F7A76|nr:HAMP domain-containing sensor histidine kinase [Actinomadura sp. K4S16]
MRRNGGGSLRRRLFAAFLLVALTSLAVLTAAALIGTDRGLGAARQSERERTAEKAAAAAAASYTAAGGWAGADLREARAIAAGAGAGLFVRDAEGNIIASPENPGPATRPGGRPGGGHGPGLGAGQGTVAKPVRTAGRTVGSVRLAFGAPAASSGRDVAWAWILPAAAAAVAAAAAASWYVSRRLTRPLARLATAARALAAGDRSARAGASAPGELGELVTAFDRMADELNRAELGRRRLAADVAHELRTPLAGLQAGLEELRDGFTEPDPARLAALHDQSLRLGRIVGDLAELSAAESAALSLRPADVDIGAVAREAVAARRAQLDAAGLTVHTGIADGVVIRADADRIHQALGNLLSNAARYCRPGDSVTVRVRAQGDEAVIEVADTGPGIPAAERAHVFERLWRGSSGRRVAGSGIGLAVVRELVAAHGGTVTASSPDAGGATFTIRLPVRR